MRVSNAVPIVLAVLILLCIPIMADVIFRYNGIINVKPIRSPITVISGSCPCGCSTWNPTYTGFTSTITAYTLSTTSGYVLTTPLVVLNASKPGTMTISLNPSSTVISNYINGTQIYPGQGSVALSAGANLLIQRLTLASPVTRTITLSGQYSYSPITGTTFYYAFAETINPPTSNIMNLLNGLQAWYVTHIYIGYNETGNFFTNQWPTYYNSSISSSSYWYYVSTGMNQPILKLTPSAENVTGIMFWNSTYGGSTVTITVIGTYSRGTTPPGTGFVFYLFLPPITANNYTALSSYTYSDSYTGTVLIPGITKKTYALIIQWNPALTGGQWNIIVYYQPGASPYSLRNVLVEGYGSGAITPNPGDYICVNVIYYPTNNTVKGVAIDLNNGQVSAFSYTLPTSTFPIPSIGTYGFGVAASTGKSSTANWCIVYVNYQSQ